MLEFVGSVALLAMAGWLFMLAFNIGLFWYRSQRAPAEVVQMTQNPLDFAHRGTVEWQAYTAMLLEWPRRARQPGTQGLAPEQLVEYAIAHGPAWPVVSFAVEGQSRPLQVPLRPLRFKHLKPGQKVHVFYLPANPHVLAIEQADDIGYPSRLALIVAMGVLCATLGTVLWYG